MKYKVFHIFIFVLFLLSTSSALAQLSSQSQDIIPLSMSTDIHGTSTAKLNVNGKNMYKWFDYPVTYGHVLSSEEDNSLNLASKEGKEREVIINTVAKYNSTAFCSSFNKISLCMKNNFQDLKGKFLNELVYKVNECTEKLPGASKATLQTADNHVKCEQIFIKTQDFEEALLTFEKIKKELAPCRPQTWFVTEDFQGLRRGEKDKYFGFYNVRYKTDSDRMDIGLEMVLNFDTYFVRMVFRKSN